jgi:4-amino-4-deoxy-L-arabinose transferase-like glycosyltransferase
MERERFPAAVQGCGSARVPRDLAAVIVVAVVIRLALAAGVISYSRDPAVFSSPDTSTYLAPVASLVKSAYRVGREPELLRPPGYPLLLVPGVLLGKVELVTIALQILLSAATASMVYELARSLAASSRVGFWAALLYALEPLSILFAVKLLSETLFTSLLVLGLLALCRHAREASRLWLMVAAVAFAACAYVRPIGYFLPLVICPFLLVGPDGRLSRRRKGDAVLLVLVSGLLVGAWQLRNYVEAGYPRFSSAGDINLWMNSLAVLAQEDETDFVTKKVQVGGGPLGYWRRHPEELQLPMKDRLAHLRSQAIATISRRPLLYLGIHLTGSVRTLVLPGSSQVMLLFSRGDDPDNDGPDWLPLTVGLLAALLPVYVFAVAGAISMARTRLWPVLLLLGIVAYFVLLSGGPLAASRFRVPLIPIFCTLAGAGIVKVRETEAARSATAGHVST